jgi:hypothetical protein
MTMPILPRVQRQPLAMAEVISITPDSGLQL